MWMHQSDRSLIGLLWTCATVWDELHDLHNFLDFISDLAGHLIEIIYPDVGLVRKRVSMSISRSFSIWAPKELQAKT